jgi:putative membrane protein
MNLTQRLWSLAAGDPPPESAAGPHDARDWQEREEAQNSNEIVAQTVATMVGRPLNDRELAVAAAIVHFSFGAAVAAAYNIYVRSRGEGRRTGLGLGTALWLTADEIAMPVLGLSRSTLQRSWDKHLQSLAAHVVYGVVTERTRRLAEQMV